MRGPELTGFIAGIAGAALFLSGFVAKSGSAILMAFSPFPFFVAALGWGSFAAAIAAGSAVAAVVLIWTVLGQTVVGLAQALVLAVIVIAPVIWISRLALLRRQVDSDQTKSTVEWYPPGHLLLWIAGLAAGGLLVAELLAQSLAHASLPEVFGKFINLQFPVSARAQLVAQTKAPSWDALVAMLSAIMPGVAAVLWQIWLTANALSALSSLSWNRRCERPDIGWRQLALPKALGAALITALALATMIPSLRYWALSFSAIAFVPYFYLGLTVVHAIPIKGPGRLALLGLFYLLLLLQAWLALAVAAIGLLEQWSGLRTKLLAQAGREDP